MQHFILLSNKEGRLLATLSFSFTGRRAIGQSPKPG